MAKKTFVSNALKWFAETNCVVNLLNKCLGCFCPWTYLDTMSSFQIQTANAVFEVE